MHFNEVPLVTPYQTGKRECQPHHWSKVMHGDTIDAQWTPTLYQKQAQEYFCKKSWRFPVLSIDTDRHVRFNKLASAWSTDLYRYAMWLCGNDALSKDLVQETFLRAWKALDSLKDPAKAKSWLITILRREFARTFERKVPKFTDLDKVVVREIDELEPDDRAERDMLRQGMMRLPPKYREPLILQVVMGYSCAEIAAQLEISKSAVMTQLFRAREQLKARLQKDGVTGNVHELF
jgi:RNA polymerase sigma-70 factor (ECF subfamily)